MSMPELSNDLIMEIIARLPLKFAVQCSVLNKTFSDLISAPNFLRRLSLTLIFHCSARDPKIFIRNSPGLISSFHTFKILNNEISILASCNGVLLLRYRQSYYVFNPLTGGIMFINHELKHDGVALAVDLDGQNYGFKLVSLQVYPNIIEFNVVVPSAAGDINLKKCKEDLACKTFALFQDKHIRPVYVNGCLHWLEQNGRRTISFHVENEKPTIIDGPVRNITCPGPSYAHDQMWFGLTDGSVQLVHMFPDDQIVIHSLDHRNNVWQLKHKIDKICAPISTYGMPFYYDGRVVLVYPPTERSIWSVSTLTREMRKGYIKEWTDSDQLFFSFCPTVAKVSDKYLYENGAMKDADLRNSLLGLQWLLIR